ncbi:MAG: flagellar hook-basal body complex protein FliE [Deltaproteobacteria bacterium]|nr:flagellar hook-basal body complex protein FliE [Deltaproteobacteria bacterium]MBI5810775.1 flagellar hook-basal body complex protein FliE [Deltaproteobacteria bacterium]
MVDSIKGLPISVDIVKGGASPIGSIGGSAQNETFGSVLKDSLDKVNKLQNDADKAIEGLAKGEQGNIHNTMIAVEKANLSFNMMLQVRNKLLQAYEEIMRTQV